MTPLQPTPTPLPPDELARWRVSAEELVAEVPKIVGSGPRYWTAYTLTKIEKRMPEYAATITALLDERDALVAQVGCMVEALKRFGSMADEYDSPDWADSEYLIDVGNNAITLGAFRKARAVLKDLPTAAREFSERLEKAEAEVTAWTRSAWEATQRELAEHDRAEAAEAKVVELEKLCGRSGIVKPERMCAVCGCVAVWHCINEQCPLRPAPEQTTPAQPGGTGGGRPTSGEHNEKP